MNSKYGGAALALGAALAAAACSVDLSGQCSEDTECRRGYVCSEGYCIEERDAGAPPDAAASPQDGGEQTADTAVPADATAPADSAQDAPPPPDAAPPPMDAAPSPSWPSRPRRTKVGFCNVGRDPSEFLRGRASVLEPVETCEASDEMQAMLAPSVSRLNVRQLGILREFVADGGQLITNGTVSYNVFFGAALQPGEVYGEPSFHRIATN